MVTVFERLASGSVKRGFPLSRIVRHMDWAAEGRRHSDDLVELEARVNNVWCRHDDAVMCGSCHAGSAHSLIGGHYHAP